MYSLLISCFQKVKDVLTDATYRGSVQKQLFVVVLALVAVLVAAGSLARAAAGPGPNDIQDSLPAWSSDGVDIAFVRGARHQLSRVLDMSAGGRFVMR